MTTRTSARNARENTDTRVHIEDMSPTNVAKNPCFDAPSQTARTKPTRKHTPTPTSRPNTNFYLQNTIDDRKLNGRKLNIVILIYY